MKKRFFFLPLALLLASCSTLHQLAQTNSVSTDKTLVKITNHDWNAVKVYIERNGSSLPTRIGFVEAEQTETFQVDSRTLENSVILIKEFASDKQWSSDLISTIEKDEYIDISVQSLISTTHFGIFPLQH